MTSKNVCWEKGVLASALAKTETHACTCLHDPTQLNLPGQPDEPEEAQTCFCFISFMNDHWFYRLKASVFIKHSTYGIIKQHLIHFSDGRIWGIWQFL